MTPYQFDNSCPLCTSQRFTMVGSRSYDAIFADLKDIWGASLAGDVIARHAPVEKTQLVECLDCGLQYFIPKIAGDSGFYSQLSESPPYYSHGKWEFEQVARLLLPHHALLDIACGEGHFLKSVESKLSRGEGIDTNPNAIGRARSAGLNVSLTDIDAYAVDHIEQYDIVCAFQVFEHLSGVMPFARAAMSCVKKGGILIVSVPNRERATRDGLWEPLDCPPHHISRWDSAQFAVLARLLGASLLIEKQILDQPDTGTLLRSAVDRFLRTHMKLLDKHVRTKAGGAAVRLLLSQPLHKLYERVGLLRYLGLWGFGMYAILQKPTHEGIA